MHRWADLSEMFILQPAKYLAASKEPLRINSVLNSNRIEIISLHSTHKRVYKNILFSDATGRAPSHDTLGPGQFQIRIWKFHEAIEVPQAIISHIYILEADIYRKKLMNLLHVD
jgi:hypothetical protein